MSLNQFLPLEIRRRVIRMYKKSPKQESCLTMNSSFVINPILSPETIYVQQLVSECFPWIYFISVTFLVNEDSKVLSNRSLIYSWVSPAQKSVAFPIYYIAFFPPVTIILITFLYNLYHVFILLVAYFEFFFICLHSKKRHCFCVRAIG